MRRWMAGFAALLLSVSGSAMAAAPVAGTDYEVLNPAQPTSNPGKIVVSEFFSYQCPHCFQFAPLLYAWAKKLPSDVVFERIPVSFGRPDWASIGQTYYALNVMNKLDDKMDTAIFDAIHVQRIRLGDFSAITDWVVKQGINGSDFRGAYTSFSVDGAMRNAEKAVPAHRVDGVPTLIIDGKYKVLGSNHDAQLATAEALIAMVRSTRGMPEPVKVAVSTSSVATSAKVPKTTTAKSTPKK